VAAMAMRLVEAWKEKGDVAGRTWRGVHYK
jgi:hypothetical protein